MNAALDLLAALVLDDGRRWGDAAAAFQREDAEAVLDLDSPTPYHFLTRARGGSKTCDLGGLAVAAMLAQLPPRSRLYGIAADLDQGRLVVDSVDGFAARTPELRGTLRVESYRVHALRSGSVLEIAAADAASAWGWRPAFLILDEISQWGTTAGPRRIFDAATTAAAKVPGARMICLSTAGDPAHWSRKVLDHALADPLWRVHEVAGPPPWIDPARLAEQRRRLLPSTYARLFENQWVATEDRLVDPELLRAAVTLEGPQEARPDRRYVIGVDLGVSHDATVAAVCHAEPREAPDEGAPAVRVVLDRLAVWSGSRRAPVQLAAVEAWLGEAVRSYGGARIVLDPWQAVGMAQRLRSRGARVDEFTFSQASVGRLAANLYGLLRNGALALFDDEPLLDELARARLREPSPGVYRIDHDPDARDDRVIAIGMAALVLSETGSPSAALPAADPDRVEYDPGLAGYELTLPPLSYDEAL